MSRSVLNVLKVCNADNLLEKLTESFNHLE